MKKPTKKLAVNKETVRVLQDHELNLAAGGNTGGGCVVYLPTHVSVYCYLEGASAG